MKNILTICGKEFRAYFAGPIAYLLMALFGLIMGYFFYAYTATFVVQGLRQQMSGQGGPMSVNDWVVSGMFGNGSVVALFLIPLISMRLFAEEKRTGTIELLLTSPVSDLQIILGKWLGAMFMYLCMLAIPMIDIALLFIWGKPAWQPILSGLLGQILFGGTILAIGTFISTLTKNQIVAGAATFSVCLLLFVLSWVTSFNDAPWAQWVAYCSIISHVEGFTRGIIDSKDIVFFLSAIFLGLFLTSRSLESLRWRA